MLEFQHSPMSRREFDLRSRFYLDLGYRLFWIFDFCDTDPPKKIMYKDINPDEETVDIVWPSQDRIRFLDNLNIFDYTDDAEQFNIFFHVYTGWGKEYEHSYPDGGTWVTWEYVNPLDRKRLFVEPRSYELEDLREFNAFYYSEDEFFELLARFAKEIEDESAINQR